MSVVDGGELLRAARRRAGLSQRRMAERAGVGLTGLVAAESGRGPVSWATVTRVLAVAGLEPAFDVRRGEPCEHVVRHLHLSLSERLYVALGGAVDSRMALRVPPHPAAWPFLPAWTRAGRLAVRGPSAVGLWVPGVPPVAELVLAVRDTRPGAWPEGAAAAQAVAQAGAAARTAARAAGVRLVEGPINPTCSVTVPLPVGVLHAPPPHELALDPACAPWRRALRVAAGLLDQEAARDQVGRRAAAHQVLDREGEDERMRWSRPWGGTLKPPDVLDGRGWRLGDEASFSSWLDVRARRG